MRLLVSAAIVSVFCFAADNTAPPPLLTAATKGQDRQVQSLLDSGADITVADRNGRNALMLAAQHGHPETVRLLLARGAKPDARDHEGFTAWGLAMFSPAGHGEHQAVLALLPHSDPWHIAVETSWSPIRLASSCFMNRDQLVWQVRGYRLDSQLLNEFARYTTSPEAKKLVQIEGTATLGMHGDQPATSPAADAQALVKFEVQPGAACAGGNDNATLSVQVQVIRARDNAVLLDRAFAGGVRGLRVQPVDNPRQLEPVWEGWLKPQGEPIYWGVAAALSHGF